MHNELAGTIHAFASVLAAQVTAAVFLAQRNAIRDCTDRDDSRTPVARPRPGIRDLAKETP